MPYVNGIKTFWPNQKKIFVVKNCGQLDLKNFMKLFENPTERIIKSKEKENQN